MEWGSLSQGVGMSKCTSHHFACYCREAEFERLRVENQELKVKLVLTESICEAASFVICEDSVKQELLCYNMGVELINRLETWRAGNPT